MKRPLSTLAVAALSVLALVVPTSAAHADDATTGLHVSKVAAGWSGSTLSVSYSWDNWEGNSSLEVLVDGASVKHTEADWLGQGTVSVDVPRAAAAGPAKVTVTAHVCTYDSAAADRTSSECIDSTKWTGTVAQSATPITTPTRATWLAQVEHVRTSWRDGTLAVKYDWDTLGDTPDEVDHSTFDVLVDGKVVNHLSVRGFRFAFDRSVRVARATSAGPAQVQVKIADCVLVSDTGTAVTCRSKTAFSKTVSQVLTPPRGSSSALALLGKLRVTKETHSSTYARSQFKHWVDANHDGENTRAEVLKAESSKRVTQSRTHAVTAGAWLSRYDGKTFSAASNLDIDHLVPLQEAWVSGAAGWSRTKRTAYANDIGYGATLIAVSRHANRSKGDKEPGGYLPAVKAYRCTYIRNWIAVKARWGLSVNVGEKHTLTAGLTTYCATPWVKTPPKPNLARLVGTTTPPRSTAGSSSSSGGTSSSSSYARGVHPGAFCSPGGAYGYTVAGTLMRCKTSATDSRNRWRSA